jgi:hypothetical protein
MTELPVFLIVSLLLIVIALWVAFNYLTPRRSSEWDASLPIDLLLPVAYLENSSEIERLSAELEQERTQNIVSGGFRQGLSLSRRRMLRKLLVGLKEDFSRLDRLMCTVAALAPEVEGRQETERLWLWFRFRLHYGLARLSVAIGRFSQPELTSICKVFDRLATRTKVVLEALEHSSLRPLRSKLGT